MTPTRITDGRQSRLRALASASLLLLIAAGAAGCGSAGAGAGGDLPGRDTAPPDLDACRNLLPPAGHRAAFRLFARGAQVYRWDGAAWVFQAPEAELFRNAAEGRAIGTHYAGPTWEGAGAAGGKVVGEVRERCARGPEAIPWLLLRATPSAGGQGGLFAGVTHILRVNTTGGVAPAEPGTAPGQVARVPYTADYFFYEAAPAAD